MAELVAAADVPALPTTTAPEPEAPGLAGASATPALASEERDMMKRFEALSNMFKMEVEGMFGREQETAREDLDRLEERRRQAEEALATERLELGRAALALRSFVARRQSQHTSRIFGQVDEQLRQQPALPDAADGTCMSSDGAAGAGAGAGSPAVSASDLLSIVGAFVEVNDSEERPELQEARQHLAELRERTRQDEQEIADLREELREARRLKSQEERDLAEFRALREKESEVQSSKIVSQQLTGRIEELEAECGQLTSRNVQQQAVLKEKSDKIIELVKRLEQQGEQLRLLADENNQLRLEMGRDADYGKVVGPPADPLSFSCAAGALSEELVEEENRFREALRTHVSGFPGLIGLGGNCGRWCHVQMDRVALVYRSFLHRLQDYSASFPEDLKLEFVSQTQEVDSEWTAQEAQMREADAAFQESEKVHTARWEEHRLQLTAERDAKVKQLLEQAERSQRQAEQQLLLHQAKLFGQRVDAQVERAWEEQRKERDLRWGEHQQKKQELRQRCKDDTLSLHKRVEERATASLRFADLARGKLAAVEDAWLRNGDKAAAVGVSALRGGDFAACLRAAASGGDVADDARRVPARGSQHTGVALVVDQLEEMLGARAEARVGLRKELEQQSLQQLRGCVEKFAHREAAAQAASQAGAGAGKPGVDDDAAAKDAAGGQAKTIVSLLRLRQHRHLADTMRRQFYDYLLVLRLCSLGAAWLLPSGMAATLGFGGSGGRGSNVTVDLPPLPAELAVGNTAGTGGAAEVAADEHALGAQGTSDDAAVEAKFLYGELSQRLLERALKILSTRQRDELLALKRAYAVEQRVALEHACQLEPDEVEKAVQQDLREFEMQVSTKLLAESEYRLNEERKRLTSEAKGEVALHLANYRSQVAFEELEAVRQRRRVLTDRLVVLQASGASAPSDRAFLQRLRQELRACEAKIEAHERAGIGLSQAASAPGGDASELLLPAHSATTAASTALSSLAAPAPPAGLPRGQRPSSLERRLARPPSAGRARPPLPASPASMADLQQPSSPSSPPRFQQPGATGQELPSPLSSPLSGAGTKVAETISNATSGLAPWEPEWRAPASPRLPLPQFGSPAAAARELALDFDGATAGAPIYEWPFEGSCALGGALDASSVAPAAAAAAAAAASARPPLAPAGASAAARAGGLSMGLAMSVSSGGGAARLRPLDCLGTPRTPRSLGKAASPEPCARDVLAAEILGPQSKPSPRTRSVPRHLPPVQSPRV
eukprot:TRINITY_DN63806_c0_g1_i1.p1 TRINITY_DN63806_c0_g1~~TRINITY_DN63806_c0_g1_i1.p1  ORF type:complete len:1244 (+),score=361.08 TRINITY_DN63806_c0_g1_i1:119-3850(+)